MSQLVRLQVNLKGITVSGYHTQSGKEAVHIGSYNYLYLNNDKDLLVTADALMS